MLQRPLLAFIGIVLMVMVNSYTCAQPPRALDIYIPAPVISNSTYTDSATATVKGVRLTGIKPYPKRGLSQSTIEREAKWVLEQTTGTIDLSTIQDIAARITSLYRQAGFVFTRAYVPQQQSTDGTVEIRLLEGHLEAVDVYDNTLYDQEIIQQAYAPYIGRVIYNAEVEEAMALTNDLPGLSAFGFYSVGEELGGTRINLRVRQEKESTGNIRLDNHGSELTGRNRIFVNWEQNNLFGRGDKIKVGLLQTIDPDNATFGLIDFSTPVVDAKTNLSFSASANDFALGRGNDEIGVLNITGESQSASVTLARKILRSSRRNFSAYTSITRDRSDSSSAELPDLPDNTQRTWDITGGLEYDEVNRDRGLWHAANISARLGDYSEGAPEGQPDTFSLLYIDAAVGKALHPFASEDTHQLTGTWIVQFSQDLLPADEQFSLTGASRLRGFEPSQFSADSASTFSLQWSFPTNQFSEKYLASATPGVFIEYGYGVQRDVSASSNDDWAEMADIGMLVSIQALKSVNINFSVAKPISHRISYSNEDINAYRAYIDLIWQYN